MLVVVSLPTPMLAVKPRRRPADCLPNTKKLIELRHFIEQAYLRTRNNKQTFSADIFADEVRYYNHGIVPRRQIIREKRRYFVRWPNMDYELIPSTITVQCLTDSLFVTGFQFDYALEGDLGEPTGRAWAELVVRHDRGHYTIVAEDGATL